MARLTVKKILKVINHPYIALYGHYERLSLPEYYYFIYDDGDKIHESKSVMLMRLSDQSLEGWVEDAMELIERVENKDA